MFNNYRLFKISFLIFCFFCWGCQKEELRPVQKEPEQRISFNERAFEEVNSIPAIKEMLKGEEKKGQVDLKTAENGRTLFEQEQNFTIDRSRIIEIINNGITSFTMAVQRDYDTPGYFENLMIDVDSEQEVNAYLIRYTPNEEIQDFPAHQTFSFHGEISVVPIQFVGSIAEYEKKHQKASETICGSTPILICSYGSYDHIAGDECIKQESRTNDGRVTTAWIPNDCNDGGGVLYDGSSYPTNEGIHESGSDGSSTGTTTPIINEDDDAATALTNILKLTEQSTIDWLAANLSEAQEMCDFLSEQSHSEAAKHFTSEAISSLENGLVQTFAEFNAKTRSFLDNNAINDFENNMEGGIDLTSYPLFSPFQDSWPSITAVIPKDNFIGWGYGNIPENCMDYAKAQIATSGYQISNYFNQNNQTLQIYTEQNGVDQNKLVEGLSYLKYALQNNIPVIVGIDLKVGTANLPTDKTTDHFVVLVGMGSDTNGNFFRFYDNASGLPSKGADPSNKLYYNQTSGKLEGKSATTYGSSPNHHDYIVTQIRKSKLIQ